MLCAQGISLTGSLNFVLTFISEFYNANFPQLIFKKTKKAEQDLSQFKDSI